MFPLKSWWGCSSDNGWFGDVQIRLSVSSLPLCQYNSFLYSQTTINIYNSIITVPCTILYRFWLTPLFLSSISISIASSSSSSSSSSCPRVSLRRLCCFYQRLPFVHRSVMPLKPMESQEFWISLLGKHWHLCALITYVCYRVCVCHHLKLLQLHNNPS